MTDREKVLEGLLQTAFEMISGANFDEDAPEQIKDAFTNWILQTHAMLCPNHPDEVNKDV
jgi:hypothetical protein